MVINEYVQFTRKKAIKLIFKTMNRYLEKEDSIFVSFYNWIRLFVRS